MAFASLAAHVGATETMLLPRSTGSCAVWVVAAWGTCGSRATNGPTANSPSSFFSPSSPAARTCTRAFFARRRSPRGSATRASSRSSMSPARRSWTGRLHGSWCRKMLDGLTRGRLVPKVLDFGISKAATAPDEGELTRTEAIIGSPRYMSPEQAAGRKDVDARADVHGLGVTLWTCAAGCSPFDTSNDNTMIVSVIAGEGRRLRAVVPLVPSRSRRWWRGPSTVTAARVTPTDTSSPARSKRCAARSRRVRARRA